MRWGSINTKQFVELQKRVEQLQNADMDAFCRTIAKELAARLIRMVKYRTPVDSGNLRRNWQSDMNVVYRNKEYRIHIYNATEYAIYVEYGHRQQVGKFVPAIGKKLKKGWVEGRFMLTKSEILLGDRVEEIIAQRLNEFLGEKLNG